VVSVPDNSLPAVAKTVVVSDSLPVGTMVGEYQIEGELGRGGMGTVYAARHPTIGKRVAIKVLALTFSCNPVLVKRFIDEARAVNKIGHPNIIDVFSYGQLADGREYFVMEFLEGETMASWLAQGRPDVAEAQRLLMQVCEALEAAHREGVIHRDLKPENLWIARPKHGLAYIKVLDFGIAKLIETQEAKGTTKTGTIMGTPQFMSPEQCMGRGVDHRTDVYALGAIMFCIYCGRPPFDGDSVAEVIAAQLYAAPPKPSTLVGILPALEALILACLEKNPALRPSSAAELGTRLKDAASVAGAATAVHAPVRRAGDVAAKTRDGYTPGLPTAESNKAEAAEGMAKRPWPLFLGVGVLLVTVGLALWLGTRDSRKTAVVPVPVAPVSASVQVPQPPSALPVQTAAAAPAQVPRPAAANRPMVPRSRTAHPSAVPQATAAQAAVPSPAPEPEMERKPSRATQQGLIQDNPF
jgi:eukaryotic-like serine/threonine-protein kinase